MVSQQQVPRSSSGWFLRAIRLISNFSVPSAIDTAGETFMKLMLPGGRRRCSANQFVDRCCIVTVARRSVSFLYFADRVNQLPLGVIGVAVDRTIATFVSPAADGADVDAMDSMNRASEFALLLTVPLLLH